MEAKLTVVGGKASKAQIALKLPTIIGRSRGAGLTVAHPMISRQHCEVFEADGLLMVRDLDSLNGTSVGGQKVKESPLPPDAEFTVGPLTFRVEYEYEGDLSELPEPVLAEKKAAAASEETPDFQSFDEPTSFDPDSVGVATSEAPQEVPFFEDLMGESESAPAEEGLNEIVEAVETPAMEESDGLSIEPEAEPEPTPPPTIPMPEQKVAAAEPEVELTEAAEAVDEPVAVEEEPVAAEETTGEPEFDFFADEELPASEETPVKSAVEASEEPEADLYGISEPEAAAAPAVEEQEQENVAADDDEDVEEESEDEESAGASKPKAAAKKKSWFGGLFGGSKKKGKEKPVKGDAKSAAKSAPAKPAKSEPVEVEEEVVEDEPAAPEPVAEEKPADDSAIFGKAEEKPAAKKSAEPAEPEDVFDDFLKGLG